MLRPATPLTVLLFVSFVLLLLSTLSTPVVKGIPLATFQGISYGIFGYCKGSQCSKLEIGYSTNSLFGSTASDDDFDLPSSARHSLSSLLVVTPVACFLNLICLGLAAASHFHGPSHSARYLLGLLILLLPTLLVTLLAFLTNILLFIPHLQWGGWIVLGSTVLIAASGVVTCAMRRTLVSRKARKKRIAENAEMSGENYYSRQANEPKFNEPSSAGAEPLVPMVSGAPGADKLPSFATFDGGRSTSDDERRPLNQQLPADPAASSTIIDARDNGSDRYAPPRSRSRGHYDGPRDEYGNPLPSSNAFGPLPVVNRTPNSSRPPDQYRRGSYGSARGRGGPSPRGGYGSRGGYAGPRGPPPPGAVSRGYSGDGRGGYNDKGRGGYSMGPMDTGAMVGLAGGAMEDRQQTGPPPMYPQNDGSLPPGDFGLPDDDRAMAQTYAQDGSSHPGPYTAYNTRQPSPGAGLRNQSPYPPRQPSPGVRRNNPSPHGARLPSPAGGFRNPSPPPPLPMGVGDMATLEHPMPVGQAIPLGHAVEMDASTRRYGETPSGYSSSNRQLQSNDADGQGMGGLQENRAAFAPNRRDVQSQSSDYGPEEYIPPRRTWEGASIDHSVHDQTTGPPVELPTTESSSVGAFRPGARPRISSGGSEHYYEDVNPRFAAESARMPPGPRNNTLPQSLSAGAGHDIHEVPIAPTASYEDLQQGARSPAESDNSNFTSISQRGVNPNWRPGGPGDMGQFGPHVMRKPVQVQQRRDVLLGGNPDFELPQSRPSRGRGGYVRGGSVRPPGPMSTPSRPGGRYPGADF